MKRLVGIIAIVLCCALAGCGSKEKEVAEYSVIEECTIYYHQEDGSYISINVDCEEDKKTIIHYIDDTSETEEEAYDKEEELLTFLEGEVIPQITGQDTKKSSGRSEEKQVKWRVCITTVVDFIWDDGFMDEEYPEYWDELLEILE